MNSSRRDLLKAVAVGGVAVGLGGCTAVSSRLAHHEKPLPLPLGPTEPTTRLVGRLTFGHRPTDIATVQAMGRQAFVDKELRADQSEDLRLTALLRRLEVFEFGAADLEDLHREEVIEQLHQASLLRAVYGANQLHERMVDLWTDHFNMYALKGDTAFRLAAADVSVIRRHALGKFPELLKATAHSPAMLGYLDSQQNRKGIANENYARELMELHTLGVHGGYSQRDVHEVARCLTGWTIEYRFLHKKGTFRFDEDRHDTGEKTVLDHRIPAGGGQEDGERVLDILVSHPSTAKFVSTKLCAYFLGAAGDGWIDKTAETYLRTGGDIPSMIRPLLLSKELIDGPPMIKRPLDLMASALRATNADTDGGKEMLKHLTDMGQVSHAWPMPDGYPMRTSAWTGSMLPRWNFAVALASGKLKGTNIGDFGTNPFEATHGRHAESADSELLKACDSLDLKNALALCLASPSFQWR